MLIPILMFLISAPFTKAGYAIDVADPVITFTCMKQAGKSLAIIRGYCSYGAVDTNAVRNTQNAKKAGLMTDIYFFPCRGKEAETQVNEFITYFDTEEIQQNIDSINESTYGLKAGNYEISITQKFLEQDENSYEGYNYTPLQDSSELYGTIWIDVEINPSRGCSWASKSVSENCDFLQQLVSSLQSHGKRVGIYSSKYMWQNLMGSPSACSYFTNLPVWYAHFDNSPNFKDWGSVKFGGWTYPSMKQYVGDITFCQADADLNYF